MIVKPFFTNSSNTTACFKIKKQLNDKSNF